MELGLMVPHLGLATSSLEGALSAYLCVTWFLRAQGSIRAGISAMVQGQGAHYHSSPLVPWKAIRKI